MSTVRLRRLQSDYQSLLALVKRQPRVALIQAVGDPPERYQLEFRVRGLRKKGEELLTVLDHLVEITLPLSYPRTPPLCRMLTPVFHPNIAPHAICIGDHWSAGESLPALVARIAELLAYQSYNTKSPLNGEAARWALENVSRLPLDPVTMTVEEAAAAPATAAHAATAPAASPRPAGPAPTPRPAELPPIPIAPDEHEASIPAVVPQSVEFTCPGCAARLRVPRPSGTGVARIRCPRCRAVWPFQPGAAP
jgi:ubiquitin-protein ligase